MSIWNELTGKDSDVVISSRVRYARNLSGFPFTHAAKMASLEEILDKVKTSTEKMKIASNLKWIDLRKTTLIDRYCLIEKHLMSPEMLIGKHPSALILNSDESLSVMVNEEDHLRIQAILPGLQMDMAYKMCNDFEEQLGSKLDYAFDDKLGYLTSCPTNLGTAMRVSAMMHLPAMVAMGVINKILEACGKIGVAVRGVYGENSEAEGNIFQISNQVTLGRKEDDIISNMTHIVGQIIEQERALRQKMYNDSKIGTEDKVFRAYGVLSNARSVTCNESMDLISWIRLGIYMNIIDFVNPVKMNTLLVDIQPGNIQKRYGENLSGEERDVKRADLCREMIRREQI